MALNKIPVSYATGRYEDYDNTKYIPGRIYYLTDDLGNGYIYLDGNSYINTAELKDALTWKTLTIPEGDD